jgi:hypothetical protein
VDAVVLGHGRLQPGAFAVDEDVDVLTDAAGLVADPPGQAGVRTLQTFEHVPDGVSLDRDGGLPIRQIPKGRSKGDDGHGRECSERRRRTVRSVPVGL